MLWFFRKRDAWLHYEVRCESAGFAFELVVTHADGRQDVETYPDLRTVSEGAAALNQRLLAEGWQPPVLTRASSTRQSAAAGQHASC